MTKISRRSFLNLAFVSGLGLLMTQWGVLIMRYLLPPMTSSGSYGGKVFAGQIDEFQVGSVNHILAGRFFIVRTDNGIIALWHKCTHLGCSVPWAQDENQFHCPCHGSLFNRVGEVTGGPAPRPLDMFPVTITDGEIWVDTGKPIQRTNFDPSQITSV